MLTPVIWSLALTAGLGGATREPAVDFTGVHEFIRIVAILERDREPAAEDWDRMFWTPGYVALTGGENPEFRRSFFKDRFRLVFMPSKRAELEEALRTTTNWTARYLQHFVHVRDRWDEVLAYMEDPRPWAMMPEARRLALEFLPPDVADYIPPVAFVVFGPDARGYVPVVLDILNAKDQHDGILVLLAHEFHHYYRNTVHRVDRAAIAPEDGDLFWVLDQLQAEGMADQINLRERFQDPGERDRIWFIKDYRRSGEILRGMGHLLARIDASPGDRPQLAAELREAIPSSGHPTGFFIANLVAERLGMDRLVDEVGNPFAFLRLYQEAALATDDPAVDAPPFSPGALRVLDAMERRYVGNPGAIQLRPGMQKEKSLYSRQTIGMLPP